MNSIGFELTRKCNMDCYHCLRGDAQNIDMSDEMIENICKTFEGHYFYSVLIGGGENSLVPDKILYLAEMLEKYSITYDYIDVTTNAKHITDEYILAIIKLYLQGERPDDDIECINKCLSISNDIYHELRDDENILKLTCLSFAYLRGHENELQSYKPIRMGRAADNCSDCQDLHLLEIKEYDEEYEIDQMYVTVNGDIYLECNFSYDVMDEYKQLSIGNINDENFDLNKGVEKYNNYLQENNIKTFDDVEDLEYETV